MPRTPNEILAHAHTTPDPHVVVSAEEVGALVDEYIARRRQKGQKIPDRTAVAAKLASGSAHIFGRVIRVE